MKLKGKMAYTRFENTAGENSRVAKLTDDDVRAIRAMTFPQSGEARRKALDKAAKKYAITVHHMLAIIRRARWRHLD